MWASTIQIRYEENAKKGLEYASSLFDNYPNNPLYSLLYVEALLASGKYVTADDIMQKFQSPNDEYYRLSSFLFKGILSERYRHDTAQAISLYNNAINSVKKITTTNENYVGLAQFQLANIYNARKDYYFLQAILFTLT